MPRVWNVFFAILCGAVIGTLIAVGLNQQFDAHLWSFLGTLSGGLIGYLAYEPQKVWKAFRAGFRVAVLELPNRRFFKDAEYRKLIYWCGAATLSALSTMTLSTALFAFRLENTLPEPVLGPIFSGFLMGVAWVLFQFLVALLYFILSDKHYILLKKFFLGKDTSTQEFTETAQYSTLLFSPIFLPYTLLKLAIKAPRFVVLVFLSIPRLVKEIGLAGLIIARFALRVVKSTLSAIHCNARLTCGAYAALGVTISYLLYLNSKQVLLPMLIGALLGATVGTLSYKFLRPHLEKTAPNEA